MTLKVIQGHSDRAYAAYY